MESEVSAWFDLGETIRYPFLGFREMMKNAEAKKVFEENATSANHHYQIIESEYARLMGMVHESDLDTFVRE